MKKTQSGLAMAILFLLVGCTTTPVASITRIDVEDVEVLVQYDSFMTVVDEAEVDRVAQLEASRGCARYDRKATYLSGQITQRGTDANGWLTQVRMLFTCDEP